MWNYGEKNWVYGPTGATMTGATGALSMVEVGATGATAHAADYRIYDNLYVWGGTAGSNLDNLGGTS